jgi:hypothetical protein
MLTSDPKDDDLLLVIKDLRNRPAMYLPELTTMALYSFILGYHLARRDKLTPGELSLTSDFSRHVAAKFDRNPEASWADNLRMGIANPHEAFQLAVDEMILFLQERFAQSD